MDMQTRLETKFCRFGEEALSVTDGTLIEGYASHFGAPDHGGDIVAKGAYVASLRRLKQEGRQVKMLWQHDPAQPIGVWTRCARMRAAFMSRAGFWKRWAGGARPRR